MKSVFTISAFILCMLQNAYGQTVRKSRLDTTAKSFINMARGCKLKYFGGGLDAGGVNVFCSKVQFELEFIAKDSVEVNVDDYIFKKVPGKSRELTNNYAVYDRFDCYALVYPQRKKQPYINYPVVVSAYKRVKNDTWKYIATVRAKTWEEFSNFHDKVIHNAYDNR